MKKSYAISFPIYLTRYSEHEAIPAAVAQGLLAESMKSLNFVKLDGENEYLKSASERLIRDRL